MRSPGEHDHAAATGGGATATGMGTTARTTTHGNDSATDPAAVMGFETAPAYHCTCPPPARINAMRNRVA